MVSLGVLLADREEKAEAEQWHRKTANGRTPTRPRSPGPLRLNNERFRDLASDR